VKNNVSPKLQVTAVMARLKQIQKHVRSPKGVVGRNLAGVQKMLEIIGFYLQELEWVARGETTNIQCFGYPDKYTFGLQREVVPLEHLLDRMLRDMAKAVECV